MTRSLCRCRGGNAGWERWFPAAARGHSGVMNGKPDGGLMGIGPFDTMACMGRDVDVIAAAKFAHTVLAFEAQTGRPRNEQHPFVLVLVVPESRRTGLPARND